MIALRAAQALVPPATDNNFFRFQENHQEAFQAAQDYFYGIIPLIQRFLYWFGVFVFLLVTSSATYAVFYVLVMPAPALTRDLHFDYTSRESPTAVVEILAQHSLWQAFADDIQPTWTRYEKLVPRQAYFLEIDLELPESGHNADSVGMFGVIVELYTTNMEGGEEKTTGACSNKIIARSIRSARFPHESRWIGTLRKFILMVPLLIGAMTETKWITIPAYRYYVEHREFALKQVRVLLEGRPYPEVLRGYLKIGKELNWLQGLLKDWFWTCSLLGVMCIMAYEVVGYVVLSFFWRRWRQQAGEQEEAYYFSASEDDQQRPGFNGDDDEDDNMWEDMPQETPQSTEDDGHFSQQTETEEDDG